MKVACTPHTLPLLSVCAVQMLNVADEVRDIVHDKTLREVTRTYIGMLMGWFSYTGELSKAFINFDSDRMWALSDATSALVRPLRTVQGAVLSESDRRINEQKRVVAVGLAQFLIRGSTEIAYPLATSILSAILWPDSYTSQRAVKLAGRLLEVGCQEPHYEVMVGNHVFHAACHLLVSQPKWLGGSEWEVMALLRDIYCMFTLGIPAEKLIYVAAANNQGHATPTTIPAMTVQAYPRQVLLSLGGVTPAMVQEMERTVCTSTDARAQREAMRDVLRVAGDFYRRTHHQTDDGGVASGTLAAGESTLMRPKAPVIMDLSEQISRADVGAGVGAGADAALDGLAALFAV